MPAAAIERYFSRGLFPYLQIVTTSASNLTSFALFDVLIVMAALWWLAAAVRDIAKAGRRRRLRALAPVAIRTVTIAAAAYLAFLAAWGLNYRRVPLQDKLAFDANRISQASALTLLEQDVEQLNALYEQAHRELQSGPTLVDPVLVSAFDEARRDLGNPTRAVAGRPKRSMFDPYFRRAGVAGMTDPFLLETMVASDLLPVERPAVIAHEWGHLAGFADESEANFLGWLTCLRGNAAHQYSAWLSLYSELVPAVKPSDARAALAKLAAGPRQDLQAIRDRLQRNISPRVSAAGWKVYDQYLKANRVDEGTASYAEVVTLILGTSWREGWRPQLK